MLSQQQSQLDPGLVTLLDKVATTSRRLQAQVDGLMRLARTGREELSTGIYDTRSLLEEALEVIGQEGAQRGARIHIGGLPMVDCNAAGIVQVFQNLLGNGVKYGGEHPVVEVDALREETGWRFSVRDRGIGLPQEQLNQLFELFERGRSPSRAPGAGIGLAVCKRIIDEHGGRIWCNPRPGGGAEFHFTLPDRD
jgi:signal transduction histidine kinase